jgi:hypothetical protein
MMRSHFILAATVVVSLWTAASGEAAICSRNGRLFMRDGCRTTEISVSQVTICAKRSGALFPRSMCASSEALALEHQGPVCATRSGRVYQREACGPSETEVDHPSLCASRSGKLFLARTCRDGDRYLGAISLHTLTPSSFNSGSGGELNFECDTDTCGCFGTRDCNYMFSTNVCDDATVVCCDMGYPETCRCGDAIWCSERASASNTIAHATADYVFSRPKYGSYRLDWCESWATNCGKPAADRFCRRHYGSAAAALTYSKESNIGHVTPTLTQVDRQLCAESFCGGFLSITCRAPATASYLADGIVVPAPVAGR